MTTAEFFLFSVSFEMDGSLPLWEMKCVQATWAPGADKNGLMGTEEGAGLVGERHTVSHY